MVHKMKNCDEDQNVAWNKYSNSDSMFIAS